jgi:ABC-type amino acid transport substrate-binding protein
MKILGCALIIFSSLCFSETIYIVSDNHPPYIDFDIPERSFLHSDIKKANLNREGIKFILRNFPYRRSVKLMESQKNHLLVTTNLHDSFSKLSSFVWLKVLLVTYSFSEDEPKSLGVIRGEKGNVSKFFENKYPGVLIIEGNSYAALFDMLRLGRVDGVVCGDLVGEYAVSKVFKLPIAKLKNIVKTNQMEFSIVFTYRNSGISIENVGRIKSALEPILENNQ